MKLRPGDIVDGRWRVVAPLGEGANGVVVHARDDRGRDVALKWLFEPDSPRVRREIELARTLRHPNIVPLLDAGVHRDHPWLAFELVRGHTLESEIARGPIAVDRVRKLAVDILRALEAAHEQHIVHRDVKPGNVMIVGDRALLLDFGAARTHESNLTGAGETIGTPRYMAPEQVASMPVDARTDLYSLGLTLAEALTGKPVYDGAVMRVLARHASPEPVPLSPDVIASPLGRVIQRATQKSPPSRFRSARHMRRALDPRAAKTRAKSVVPFVALASFLFLAASAAVFLVATKRTERPEIEAPTSSSVTVREAADAAPTEEDSLSPAQYALFNEVQSIILRAGWRLEARRPSLQLSVYADAKGSRLQFIRPMDGSTLFEWLAIDFMWNSPKSTPFPHDRVNTTRVRKNVVLVISTSGRITAEEAARILDRAP